MSDTNTQQVTATAQPSAALLSSCRDQMIALSQSMRPSMVNQVELTKLLKRQQFHLCKDTMSDDALDLIAATAWRIVPPVASETKKPAEKKKAAPKPRPIHDVKPSEDFLSDYVRYADYLETPKEAHEIAAMMLIASVANGNITIMNGTMPVSLDLWTVILKQSGDGGNSLLRPFRAVLEAAGLDDVGSGITFGSTSHAMQHFADRPKDLLVLPEMSGTLDDWKQRHFGGLIPFITNLYDEDHKPDDKGYRDSGTDKQGNETKTPDIDFSEPPRLCILGISSSTWFFKAIQNKDFKGGFWPRFIMEWIEDSGKLIATPVSSAKGEDVLRLAAKLQQITELKGEMRLTPKHRNGMSNGIGKCRRGLEHSTINQSQNRFASVTETTCSSWQQFIS